MEEKARREDLTLLLSEMKAENGPPTAKEKAWARARKMHSTATPAR
jgi:hypothetical protein